MKKIISFILTMIMLLTCTSISVMASDVQSDTADQDEKMTITEMIGHALKNTTDIREHMEEIRICLRGHNLYDIFYGRFRKNETEILKSYIEEAPRDTFKDILDAIDRFVYFENRKK